MPIHRRDCLRGLAAGALAAAPPRRRPNVLLILTDDQGYGDLSLHGNPHLRTPNLDQLARQGTEFTRFYVSPVCAPTRASLLTGRYNLRCGVWGVTHGKETMRPGETTLAETLREAGYRTALIGKWHLGEHYPGVPHAQGFERFIGYRTGHWMNYFDTTLELNGKPYPTRGYITDALTGEAIRFLEASRAAPFFLYLAYNVPHSPFQVPERYFRPFKQAGLPDPVAAVYGMVTNLDENIGRLMARLAQLGLAENTIVIFLTDNGPNGQRYNAALRAAKGSVYEGGVRVPFFIRWPGRLEAGRRLDRIAAHIDVYPTLLELCGVPLPKKLPLDGRSLAPLLAGKAAAWPDRLLFTHREAERNPSATWPGAVRTQRFNLVNGTELYEIPADPGEQNNLAAKYPDQAKELRAAYEAWYAEAGPQCGFQRPPIPVGYAEEPLVVLPAPQSYPHGHLRFRGGPGWAHDWITGWTSLADSVHWEIDVARPGSFEVSLLYLCPASDLGSKIRLTVAGQSLEATLREATPMERKPSRAAFPEDSYPEMHWATLPLGRLELPVGKARLALEALSQPGAMVMDLKEVRLRLL
jgi:arylsulfatase A